MLKIVVISVLLAASGNVAQAQSAPPLPAPSEQLSGADLSAILDARIAATKFALQLNPEQTKFWPPIEEAIRARAALRHVRIDRLQRGQLGDTTILELMRQRADALIQRGNSLKKLADAWQPLAATLSEDQKHRLAVLTLFVLREAREVLPRRSSSIEIWEEDDEDR